MSKQPLIDQLDEAISRMLANPDAVQSPADAGVVELVRIAADLCDLPKPGFKTALKADLERKASMIAKAFVFPPGFRTITPYLVVPGKEFMDFVKVVVASIDRALEGLPKEQVRLHVCWGSGLGPHQNDIDLADIIDIILRVKAQVYSIEAANPRHQHEWRVWQEVKLPSGKSFMPGVISHATDIIEHPRLVADRLVQYAGLVGKENVIAGTDCGVGSRVWNGEIAWAKFAAMAEGARIASQELWS